MDCFKEKSCYVLELSVSAAGYSHCLFFAYNKIEYICSILEQHFYPESENWREAMAVFALADETIALWVIQAGKLVQAINLRSYITVYFPNGLTRRLDGESFEFEDEFKDEYVFNAKFDLKWDAIAKQIPVLQKPLLQPGEWMEIKGICQVSREIPDSYVNKEEDCCEIGYGMWASENYCYIEDDYGYIDPDRLIENLEI